jgi:hypothetical protein
MVHRWVKKKQKKIIFQIVMMKYWVDVVWKKKNIKINMFAMNVIM